jgi:hypothetical protein
MVVMAFLRYGSVLEQSRCCLRSGGGTDHGSPVRPVTVNMLTKAGAAAIKTS